MESWDFLHSGRYPKNFREILGRIREYVHEELRDYENFMGLDFCDVGADGIQIRGHHKELENYTFGEQYTIKYDFSNWAEAMYSFIRMWKEYDNPDYLQKYKEFLSDGEKYGWD